MSLFFKAAVIARVSDLFPCNVTMLVIIMPEVI